MVLCLPTGCGPRKQWGLRMRWRLYESPRTSKPIVFSKTEVPVEKEFQLAEEMGLRWQTVSAQFCTCE